MEEVSALLIKHAYVVLIISAGYALLQYKKLVRELKIFSWFIFLSALIQVVSSIYWNLSMNNLWLLHLYVGAGFLILAWFYNCVLKGFINTRVIWISASVFTLFTIINAIFIQGFFSYASYSLTVESILIIILSLSTFIFLLDDLVKEVKAPLVKSLNWINSGLFLYYTSSLLLFYFGEMITELFSRSASLITWGIHFIFLVVMHVCFIIGLWYRPKN